MWWRRSWLSLNGTIGIQGQERGTLLRHSAPQHQPTDPCTCIWERHDQCGCKLTVRAGLPGATIRALVPRAPTCIWERHDQCGCKLTVRAGLPGATIRALVPRAPTVDLCPGRLATTDAQ